MAYVNPRVRVIAAQIVGQSDALDGAIGRVAALARAGAARRAVTGHYLNSFEIHNVPGLSGTGRSVRDRILVNTDVGAAAIEYGHIVRVPGSRRVRYVPGQHIMSNALARA